MNGSDIQIIECRPAPSLNEGNSEASWIKIPVTEMVKGDGCGKSAAEIEQLLKDKGVDLNKPMALSCGGAITASYNYAAISNLACCKDKIYLYDGSWAEYGARRNE